MNPSALVEEARTNHREQEQIAMYQLPDVSGRYRYKIGTKAKEPGARRVGRLL
jgi:hypothetical protein